MHRNRVLALLLALLVALAPLGAFAEEAAVEAAPEPGALLLTELPARLAAGEEVVAKLGMDVSLLPGLTDEQLQAVSQIAQAASLCLSMANTADGPAVRVSLQMQDTEIAYLLVCANAGALELTTSLLPGKTFVVPQEALVQTGGLALQGVDVNSPEMQALTELVLNSFGMYFYVVAGWVSSTQYEHQDLYVYTDDYVEETDVRDASVTQMHAVVRSDDFRRLLRLLADTLYADAEMQAAIVDAFKDAGATQENVFAAINSLMTVGQLTSFLSYANQYTKPFNEISGVVTELQNALASAARVFELIDEKPIEPEPADAFVLKQAEGRVDLDHVDFSYVPENPLIENLNLHVEPGQRVALVGPTGCGKTTVINLLMRFYDVNSGSIRMDGHDIREMTRRSLRANYGMVLQDTWLKAGTIRENIAYGRPSATLEEVMEAAREAHAHSFIKRMPQGYDTVIGEDGGSLSQGQKQLLCIARVMLCLPPVLILDEATSSIDTRTEIRVQQAFARMMEGRTSFIVAHRLSTIREADVILVMKAGHIVEQGRHEELLKKNGFYAQIYNSQFAAE